MARVKYYDPSTGTWKRADESNFVAPVQSVNGKTGAVVLNASDFGIEPGAGVEEHNDNQAAHPYLLGLLSSLRSEAMLKSDISIKKAKLTLEDGTEVLIDVVVTSEGTTIQKYTNQVPLSVDSSDWTTIYGTDSDGDGKNDGYKNGYRLSSSGAEKTLAQSAVTGYIPAKAGDTIRIYGCGWGSTAHGMNYIAAYKADGTFIGAALSNSGPDYGTPMTEEETNWAIAANGDTMLKLANVADIAWIRVNSRGMTSATTVNGSDMLITVNEEIS
jgi:hypothetical protein